MKVRAASRGQVEDNIRPALLECDFDRSRLANVVATA
jgi:hypothetical protein